MALPGPSYLFEITENERFHLLPYLKAEDWKKADQEGVTKEQAHLEGLLTGVPGGATKGLAKTFNRIVQKLQRDIRALRNCVRFTGATATFWWPRTLAGGDT